MIGVDERVVADDMRDALELLTRRAMAGAMDGIAYDLRHGLEDDILHIVGGKNIVETTQKLTGNGSKIQPELAFKIKKLVEKQIKIIVKEQQKRYRKTD
jgi:hypothetical protein